VRCAKWEIKWFLRSISKKAHIPHLTSKINVYFQKILVIIGINKLKGMVFYESK